MLRKLANPLRYIDSSGSSSGLVNLRESMVASEFWNEDGRQPLSVILYAWFRLANQVSDEIGKHILKMKEKLPDSFLQPSSLKDIFQYVADALAKGPPQPKHRAGVNPPKSAERDYIIQCEDRRTILEEISRLVSNVSAAGNLIKATDFLFGEKDVLDAREIGGRVSFTKIETLESVRAVITAGAHFYSHKGDYSYAWAAACETPAHLIATLWRRSVMDALEGYEELAGDDLGPGFSIEWPGYSQFHASIKEPLVVGPRIPTTMDPMLIAAGTKSVFEPAELRAEKIVGSDPIYHLRKKNFYREELPIQVWEIAAMFHDTYRSIEKAANFTRNMVDNKNMSAKALRNLYDKFLGRVARNENLRPVHDAWRQKMDEIHARILFRQSVRDQSALSNSPNPAIADAEEPVPAAPGG